MLPQHDEAGPRVQEDHYYVEALRRAIKANDDPEDVKFLLKKVKKVNELYRLDSSGKNFLSIALEARCRDSIIKLLLNALVLYPGALFNQDSAGRTSLWYAVKNNANYCIHRLLELADKEKNHKQPGYRYWLQRDNEGNNLLHIAPPGNIEIFKLLISYFARSRNFFVIVNRTNAQGNMPLHCALSSRFYVAIELLQQSGANFSLTNNQGLTPYDMLLQIALEDHPLEEENHSELEVEEFVFPEAASEEFTPFFNIFSKLNDENRRGFLSVLKKSIVANPKDDDEHIENDYKKSLLINLALRLSLKSSLLAKINWNKIPIDNKQSITLPEELLNLIPSYQAKLQHNPLQKEGKQEVVQDDFGFENACAESQQQRQVEYMLSQDRKMLTAFIQEINDYHQNLVARPNTTLRDKRLAILIPILYPLMVGGLIGSLIQLQQVFFPAREQNNNTDITDINSNKSSSMSTSESSYYTFVVILGCFLTLGWMGACYGGYIFFTDSSIVSDKEYKDLINRLYQEIGKKLNALDEQSKQNAALEAELPTSRENINRLKNKINTLLAQKQNIVEARQLFGRLEMLLKTIRFDMNRNNKPISCQFFQRPTALIPATIPDPAPMDEAPLIVPDEDQHMDAAPVMDGEQHIDIAPDPNENTALLRQEQRSRCLIV